MTDLFAELEWRGFVHHATPGLKAHLAKGPVSAYCGFVRGEGPSFCRWVIQPGTALLLGGL